MAAKSGENQNFSPLHRTLLYTLWVKNSLEIALTHLAMEIHLQTTDHLVAVEKVAKQHIGTQLCSCNTFEDTSHLLIMVIIKN